MKRIVMAAIIISVATKMYSQVDESTLSFNYTLTPTGNDGVGFYRTDFGVDFPFKVKKGLLTHHVEFNNYQIVYSNDYGFSTSDLSEFYDINYGLAYTFPLSSNWIMNVKLQTSIISNLVGAIGYDDLFLSGDLFVTKEIESINKAASFSLGVSYSAVTGTPRAIPIISFTKSVSDRFYYSIGFPKTFANYIISDKSTIRSSVLVDGEYANLNTPTFVNTTDKVSKASFSSTSLGLEYNYIMDGSWMISLKAGYSFNNKYTLLNASGNEVFDFNTKAKPFFFTGIKFNFKNNSKKTDYGKQ